MGDALYPLLGAGALVIVGFFFIMKLGNKLGWLIIAGAVFWAYTALQPAIESARRPAASGSGSRGVLDTSKAK